MVKVNRLGIPVNDGAADGDRTHDRGWRTVGQIARDLEPYFARLRSLREVAAPAGAPGVEGAKHGSLYSLRRIANLGGVPEQAGPSLARRLDRKARRPGARRSRIAPGGKAA